MKIEGELNNVLEAIEYSIPDYINAQKAREEIVNQTIVPKVIYSIPGRIKPEKDKVLL